MADEQGGQQEMSLEKKHQRADRELRGTPLQLGDGSTWVVSSLVPGVRGKELLDILGQIERGAPIDTVFDFMYKLLRINYPTLTRDEFDQGELISLDWLNDFVLACRGMHENSPHRPAGARPVGPGAQVPQPPEPQPTQQI